MAAQDLLPEGHGELLAEAKATITGARQRALLAVSTEMLQLYWRLGRLILSSQQRERWGTRVVLRRSADPRAAFPGCVASAVPT